MNSRFFRYCFYFVLILYTYLLFAAPSGEPPRFNINDKVLHFAGFASLSGVFFIAYRFPLVKSMLLMLAYGLFTEGVQGLLPYRTASLGDLIADVLGALAGLIVTRYLINQRNQRYA